MTKIPVTIQTALQANIIINGSKLRELLAGSTNQQFLDFVASHCNILISDTGLTEEDLPAAIQAAAVARTRAVDGCPVAAPAAAA